MSRVLTFCSALLASMRGSRVSRDAEILFLRQQLLVLRRSAPARLRLRNTDRLIFVWLYAAYYHGVRTHLALGKDAPLRRPVQSVGRIVPVPLLGGLHHHYVRMA